MNVKLFFIPAIFSLLLFLFAGDAYACYFMDGGSAGKLHINIGSLEIPNDSLAPVGTVLLTKQGTMSSLGGAVPGEFSCGKKEGKPVDEDMQITADGSFTADAIYPTNIQGVGVKLYYYSAVSFGDEPTSPTPLHTSFHYHLKSQWTTTYQNVNAALKLEIVKTASISEMGDSGPLSFSAPALMKAETLGLIDLTISGNVIVPACSVDSSTTTNVSLGNVFETDIPQVGSVAKKTRINLNLNCSAVVEVSINVSGNENEDVKNKGIVKLRTPEGYDPGIGAQVLYEGMPVNLNSTLNTGYSQNGLNSIPLEIQYYRTRDKIVVGAVNGVLTLDFIYK